ncbi:MAG TPA: class I SAM-dependent methyltransferase [Candidatus Bathyarchaeia archaeon]|nr:class I SAM-dependent methyltransferase [Candidatus Bathyarchaeia archaeon]
MKLFLASENPVTLDRPPIFPEGASEQDIESSASLFIFKHDRNLALRLISVIDKQLAGRERLIDLGVGYGFIAKSLKETLGFQEALGVDEDEKRLEVARSRGIIAYQLDLEKDPLPFPAQTADLATSFGLLNYFKSYDSLLSETNRVLRLGGIFALSVPNLGWWVNRVSLGLGYQPPNIGVSMKYTVGMPNFYPRQTPTKYVHTVTLRALKELLEKYGFKTIKVFGGREPSYDDIRNRIARGFVKTTDRILSKSVGLSVRLFIVSKKIGPNRTEPVNP